MDTKTLGIIAGSLLLGAVAGATGDELLTGEAPPPVEVVADSAPDPVEVEAAKLTEAEALTAVKATKDAADCPALEDAARVSARRAEAACADYKLRLYDADTSAQALFHTCEAGRLTHAADQAANLACQEAREFSRRVWERKIGEMRQ